jgi:uncharacterized protein YcbK (DUF882 family)
MLLQHLDAIREKLGRPVTITSGLRCSEHNRAVGGRPTSAHLKGLAVDISCGSSIERYELLGALFTMPGFTRIGIARDFIHVDIDVKKPQRVVWIY